MRYLYGKGIWAWKRHEVPRAIEIARAIDARFVFYKTGQAGTYFERPAQSAARLIGEAGLAAIAWSVVTCRDPEAEADVAIRSILDGYAGLVFDVQQSADGQHVGAARLGEIMVETELPQETMFLSSVPNVMAHPELPLAEMARFCQGGFMPQAYACFGWNPRYTLDVVAYREFEQWADQHQYTAPIYPIVGFYRDAEEAAPLTTSEVRRWLAVLEEHQPTFYSLYRAASILEEAWAMLAETQAARPGQQPGDEREGDYARVRPGETVSSLCAQHRCSTQQFWAWNGHLWDVQGQRRDPGLLEHGWVVRVG
jgi:hypothetical protein